MTKIKLCGMMREADIEAANALRPDYVGFVFYEKSRRNLSEEAARALRAQLLPEIPAVGVFVNADPERIRRLYEAGIIATAQLHGTETEEDIRDLRRLCPGLALIQAVQLHSREDLQRAENSAAEYLLLDSGAGSGKTFPWEWLSDFPKPYFLAGGLNVENVSEALKHLRPFAVDVSSGIETEGRKDPGKMAEFVARVRQYQV